MAKTGYRKELWGSDYSWTGGRWLNDDMISYIDSDHKNHKSDIYKVLNGATGLWFRDVLGTAGASFVANYKASYDTANYNTYGIYAYDSIYLLAYTIQSMISNGEDFNTGSDLAKSLRSADMTGASGTIKFIDSTNDRSGIGFSVVNIQDKKLVQVQTYDPNNPTVFSNVDDTEFIFGDGSKKPAEDEWPNTFECPFAENMVEID